ncbi:hypothetical protein CK820_G0056175 [Pan troglodytes]|uniref:Uncharacterized protein n=1 Tax=Pan troglodytes TaxID=9598 RepID=A0A2J8IKM3_PANTR|nr:hypothetical protein CK820_G0056175 [Pan troglodytes]
MPPAHQLGRPALVPPSMPAGRGWSGDLLCCGLSLPVVSSDSDSDSDLSSSSLEDRLPPTGVRDRKGDKPWKESGGSVEAPRMGFTHPPGHLSGCQSSLASETGTGSADPPGGPRPGPTRRAPVKDTPGRAPAADAAPAGPSSCLG